MGLSHSSAPVGGAGEFCSTGNRTAEPVAKRRALKGAAATILLAGIRVYQAALAPLMACGCKFYPTCSQYAYEAIARHGARRGSFLAAKRLLRCRPFTRGGHDPVPDLVTTDARQKFASRRNAHPHETGR